MACKRAFLWGMCLVVLSAPALAGQGALSCEAWNTKEYFRTATVET